MEITKHNICQEIEQILKSQNIRFSIENQDYRGTNYELFVSSMEAYIQIEYDLNKEEDNDVQITFYTKVNSDGLSLYESDWDNYDNSIKDGIETEIEELINAVKRINFGISKIESKIEQIRNICEEYNLELDKFIDVLYDFN